MSNDNLVTTAAGSMVEIQSIMVLSTGHLTKTTAETLNADKSEALPWAPQLTWAYGWVWYVDSCTWDSVDFPPEFGAILKLALALDCLWVRFDADGPQIDELPFYEW
jgi:hypothetical protein